MKKTLKLGFGRLPYWKRMMLLSQESILLLYIISLLFAMKHVIHSNIQVKYLIFSAGICNIHSGRGYSPPVL